MLAQTLWVFDFGYWLTWVHIAMGLGVGWLVYTWSGVVLRRRRRSEAEAAGPAEEDLPWEELLELMKQRYQGRAVEHLNPDELREFLLTKIPRNGSLGGLGDVPEEAVYLEQGAERRTSRRRWFNPTAISVYTPLQNEPLHGIVVNRSTGGLGMLTDGNFPQGTVLFVRSVEAPAFISPIKVQVRHSRQAGRMWLVGCQFCEELPWNVKVWFG